MTPTLNELFRLVILQNEVSGNMNAVLRFSDPDGPSGRSGWSFGLCQFDTKHNDTALTCLKECGFTDDEITGVVNQNVDVKALACKLVEHTDVVARYDEAQLSHCLDKAIEFNIAHNIIMVDTVALLAVADYVNQYGSEGDGIATYFNSIDIKRPVIGQDVQDFKLDHTVYGQNHRADCIRRYSNILKVVA